jgi:hypothetical protein
MDKITRKTDADAWIAQLFGSKSARRGAVVRRSVRWVAREIGDARFREEVRRRGFHLLQTADQYIVVCHPGPIHLIF